MSKRQKKIAEKNEKNLKESEDEILVKNVYFYNEMIHHLKICPDQNPTFLCPKCPQVDDAKRMNEDKLKEHLENECPYMLVNCARCHDGPV